MIGEDVMVPSSEADQLRQQLLQAQKLSSVGALASSVAHEFNNILTTIINARQAMPRGGHLRIEVRDNPRAQTVELRVSDTGVGIPPERLRLIFEPFYTTKEPDEHGHGGTGLGLSVCRQIIEQHQGRIRVESVVGKGSTFTVKLPLLDRDE